MEVFERLVAADFDHAADFLVGEFLTRRPTPCKKTDRTYKRFPSEAPDWAIATRLGRFSARAELLARLRPFHCGISSSGMLT